MKKAILLLIALFFGSWVNAQLTRYKLDGSFGTSQGISRVILKAKVASTGNEITLLEFPNTLPGASSQVSGPAETILEINGEIRSVFFEYFEIEQSFPVLVTEMIRTKEVPVNDCFYSAFGEEFDFPNISAPTIGAGSPPQIVSILQLVKLETLASINNFSPTNNEICEEMELITNGCPARTTYFWNAVEYQLRDDTVWRELVSYGPYGDSVRIDRLSTPPSMPDANEGDLIRLRLRYLPDPTLTDSKFFSDVLEYKFVNCTPEIVSHTSAPTSCSGSIDGRFSLTFEDILDFGESIDFSLYLGPISDSNIISNPTGIMYSGQSYTWSEELDAGTYNLTYQLKPNGFAREYGPITITSPPLLQFTAVGKDVTCSGARNGEIVIDVDPDGFGNIGTPPYRYSIDGGTFQPFSSGATHTRSNLSPRDDDYTIRVIDANGCTEQMSGNEDKVVTVTISQPNEIMISGGTTAATGFGVSDGEVNISVSGGTSPYSYVWSNGATTQNISGLSAGTYTVTVTDRNGCTKLQSFDVTEPPLLTTSITVLKELACFGNDTGSLRADTTGGVSPYTFSWTKTGDTSFSESSQTISGLNTGQYIIQVTDANGNTASTNITLSEPTELQFAIESIINVDCFGESTGSIDISITRGTSPYTINWLDGAATEDRTGLSAGVYAFQITDANGCIINNYSNEITISQPSILEIEFLANGTQDPSSNGASDGAINVDVSGGTPPYLYSWSNGVISQDISGLLAGTYTLTVTDANGCITNDTYTLVDPPPLVVSINTLQAILCNGDTANLQASASGGVPIPSTGYTYQWFSIIGGIPTPLGITTVTINNLTVGNYRVEVTDNSGTMTSDDITLTEPAVLQFDSASATNVSCFGGNNGTVGVSVSGGTPEYTYSWTKTGDGSFSANTSSISSITVGTYDVTVTDANGCSIIRSFTIAQPSSAVSVALDDLVPVTIFGGSDGVISISTSGGTPGYTYVWTKTGDASFTAITEDLTDLTAGEYTIMVSDTNAASTSSNTGCITTQTFMVIEPLLLAVDAVVNTPISCFESGDGQLTAAASGGMGNYTYEWFRITGGVPLSLGVTTSTLRDLSGGEYEVRIMDANGATANDTIILIEPALLEVSLTGTTDILCFGESTGVIDIEVAGGTGMYSYEWFDQNGMLAFTDQDLSGIPIGNYSVIVTDENGCTASLGPITITQPASAISVTNVSITDLTGFRTGDGSVSVTADGGISPYTYEWRLDGTTVIIGNNAAITNLQAGDYELTITDTNVCMLVVVYTVTEPPLLEITTIDQTNQILCFSDTTAILEGAVSGGVSPYQYSWYNSLDDATILSATNIVSNIGAGNYVFEVTDANGIQTSGNYTVNQPDELVVTFVTTNVSCKGANNGSIDLSVNGGIGNYSFFWSNGANTEDVSGLIAGNYTITVRDQNFCEALVNITINEPAEALSIANVAIVNTTGSGRTDGSITINVAGGTPTYSYQWTDTNTNVLGSVSNVLDNIGAGSYFVTATDANGCILGSVEYIVSEPGPLVINVSEIPIACFGETGQLIANANGGVPPYTYEWFDASSNLISTSISTESIATGTYSIRITDFNGNRESLADIVLTQPDLLEVTAEITTDVNCYGGNDGSIEVTVVGGTGNYIYNWSNSSSTTNIINGLTAGNYDVTVTDDNGCTVSSNMITISEPTVYDVTGVSLIRPSGSGVTDGSIDITITGGVSPYDYEWTNSTGTILQFQNNVSTLSNSISGLQEGVYTILITDAEGCTIMNTYNLANPGELLVSIDQIQPISCFGGSDGVLEAVSIGGAGGNNYEWYDISDGSVVGRASRLIGVSAGSYYVIVSNADGIQEQSAVFVVSEPIPISGNLSQIDPRCFSVSDGSIIVSASGGNGNYEYRYRTNGGNYSTWIPFASSSETQITGLGTGQYEVQLMDTNSCFYEVAGTIGVLSTSLTEPSELIVSSEQLNEPTGFGLTDGSIEVTVTGGTPPYMYQWSDISGASIGTTNVLSDITAGDYTLIATDANGCQLEQMFKLNEPNELIVNIEIVNVILCNQDSNGSLRAIPQGGIGSSYTYQWFEAVSTASIGNSELLDNLGAGSYYVVVTDANGNSVRSSDYVLTEPIELSVELNANFILCGDGNDWEVISFVNGGTAPYSYVWSNGATTTSIDNVAAGNYNVIITDTNGCMTSSNIDLIAPPALTISENIIIPTCFAGDNASISITTEGGMAPYTYLWNNGATTSAISGLTSGDYQVTVTDVKGCELTQAYVINDPEQLTLDLGSDVTLCVDQTQILNATITDGINYQWTADNGFVSNDAVIEVSEEGIYTVIVTNGIGCTATDQIAIIRSNNMIFAEFAISTQVFTDKSFILVDLSRPKPDEVSWVFPSEAQIIEQNEGYAEIIIDTAGEYEITIISRLGDCQASQTKKVLVIESEGIEGEGSTSQTPIIIDYTIYPNPSDGNFTIDVELKQVQPISIKIFGLLNNSLVDYKAFDGETEYQTMYNLEVPSGIYFILLETQGATQLRKIVIE